MNNYAGRLIRRAVAAMIFSGAALWMLIQLELITAVALGSISGILWFSFILRWKLAQQELRHTSTSNIILRSDSGGDH